MDRFQHTGFTASICSIKDVDGGKPVYANISQVSDTIDLKLMERLIQGDAALTRVGRGSRLTRPRQRVGPTLEPHGHDDVEGIAIFRLFK